MSNQLVKRDHLEGYRSVFPKTFIDAIKDRNSGMSLAEILQGFNMYFLSYTGDKALTRCSVPSYLRKEGLWITYVLYDHTVITEWYNSDNIDDEAFGSDDNWRQASNMLVGDISVSADGYWVIGGEKTSTKAQGETGVTPLLRFGDNNKLQASYNEGKEWEDISGDITNNLKISKYIGINEALPTSGIAEGTIYMKGPYYDENDTNNDNPIYRMWVYAWKGDTLAWQDNGEFTSILAGVVQETGNSTTQVMSQDAVTRELTKLSEEVYAENNSEEFIYALTDKDGKVLVGIRSDGTFDYALGVPKPIVEYVNRVLQDIQSGGESENNQTIVEVIDDVEERLEIVLDADGKVVDYRDNNGVFHRNRLIVDKELILSPSAMTEFQRALVESGFNTKQKMDWSNEENIVIPTPSFAIINISIPYIPTTKATVYDGSFEFYDRNGNYFLKPISSVTVQGNSSLQFMKKNFSFDFEDCSLKVGNWVTQDSFHLKAWYIDAFRGKAIVSYNMVLEEQNLNKYKNSRPWLKYRATKTDSYNGEGNMDLDLNTEARGVPDGFPVELYINGEYYGLMSLNLKKHRDNYVQKKNDANAIHIDGNEYQVNFFNGVVNWAQTEIRNPKGLKDINGNSYDGDNPKELTGDSSVDETSALVKEKVLRFSTIMSQLAANPSKETFEMFLDKDYCIDYLLHNNFLFNVDSINKNTQWVTYDGMIWIPLQYDHDQVFGNNFTGIYIRKSMSHTRDLIGKDIVNENPLRYVFSLYKEDMEKRYKELVDAGILTVENVIKKLSDWCSRIGTEAYKKELEKWSETPSYRSPLTNDGWEYVGDDSTGAVDYNASSTYNNGDKVKYVDGLYYVSKKTNVGVPPTKGSYANYPNFGGYYDSVLRVFDFLTERKAFMDEFFNYK